MEPNILDRPVGRNIIEALALGLFCNDEVHLKLPAFCHCSRVESNMMNHPLGSDINAALALGLLCNDEVHLQIPAWRNSTGVPRS